MDGYFLVGDECHIKMKVKQKTFEELLVKYPDKMYYEIGWGCCLIVPTEESIKFFAKDKKE